MSGPAGPACQWKHSFRQYRALRRVWAESQGQELAEAAFVLPLLLAIIFAIFWFGLAFNTYESMTRAAREGARIALAPTCATCAVPGCSWQSSGGANTHFPCADPTIYNAVATNLSSAGIAAGNIIDYAPAVTLCTGLPPAAPAPGCTTVNHVRVCRGVRLGNSASTPQECGTVVSFGYPFRFSFSLASLPAVTLKTQVQMREEY